MTRTRSLRVARGFRRAALPMASYYAVTLALPLANGAAHSGAFAEHALVVLVVPPVVIILACAISTLAHVLAGVCPGRSLRLGRKVATELIERRGDACDTVGRRRGTGRRSQSRTTLAGVPCTRV